MSIVVERDLITTYLNNQLVGPFGGSEEVLGEKPHKRYLIGILFPLGAVEDDVDDDTPDEVDNTVSLSSEFKPSAMALSFAVSGSSEICIDLTAGTYEKNSKEWYRSGHNEKVTFKPAEKDTKTQKILDGKASLKIVKRPWKEGWILTVALSNDMTCGKILDTSKCLFQT